MIFFPGAPSAPTPLSVEAAPDSFYEERGTSSGTVGTVTLTITGGVAPYIASWVNGDPGIVVSSPTSTTSSAITFSGLASVLDFISDTVAIVVEDSVGQTDIFYVSIFVVRTR